MRPHRPLLPGLSRRGVVAGLAATALARPALAQQSASPVLLRAAPIAWPLRPPPARPTPLWSYGESPSGPVIRAMRGDDIAVTLANALPNPTSLHIAGARLPNALDGVPGLAGAALTPGASVELRIPARDAGFFTFGPGAPADAAEQSARGLGGVLIVGDPADPAVEADVVLVLKDWLVEPDGALTQDFAALGPRAGQGRLGNILTIDGLDEPRRLSLAPGARFRLRIANACNARILPLKFEGMHPTLIGVSGQPSVAFTPLHGELLAVPGSRFDLVCDLPRTRDTTPPTLRAMVGAGIPLLAVTLADEPPRPEPAPVVALPDNGLPLAIALGRATRVDCVVARRVYPADAKALAAADPARLWTLNGQSGDFARPPLFSVKRGAPVVIAVRNTSDVPIVMKLNGHVARLLHPRDDGWVPYWVDVVLVAPGITEHIAFIADNPGHWLFGARVLEHLAGGQFGWFEVV